MGELACGPDCRHERLVALCERAARIAGTSPFAGSAVWSLYHAALLLRAQATKRDTGVLNASVLVADREARWRVAVRGVQRYPLAKSLWVLQLAAWEARGVGTGRTPDEDEALNLVEAIEARGISLHADPLGA